MKEFRNIEDLSKELKVPVYEVEKEFNFWCMDRGNGYFHVNNVEVVVNWKDNERIYIPLVSEKDRIEFFIKHEVSDYIVKCYIDDIEEWQEVKVIDMYNFETETERAVVVSEAGTQVVRLADFIFDNRDLRKTGNVYFIEKQ